MFKHLTLARLFPAFLLLLIASSPFGALAVQQDLAERPEEIEFIVVDTQEQFPISEYDIDEKWHLEDAPMSPFAKGVHYYFSGAGLVYKGITQGISYFFTDTFIKQLPPAPLSQEYTQVVQETIAKSGVNPNEINIVGTTLPHGMVAAALGKNGMLIDPAQSEQATQAEKEFIISHEHAHLNQHHILKQAVVSLALPFIAHYGLKAWDSAVHRTICAVKKTFKITKDTTANTVLNKIDATNHWISTFCVTKAAVAGAAFNAYSRRCEKQADIAAIQALKTSSGAEAFFKRLQETYKAARVTQPINQYLFDDQGNNIHPMLHPRPSERIEYVRNHVHAG